MSITTFQAQLSKHENVLATLLRSKSNAEQRIAELKAERSTLVLSARANGDAGAQERIKAIDQELAALNRDLSDDSDAATEVSRLINEAHASLVIEEHTDKREKLREQVTEAAKRAQQNLRKLDEFKQGVNASIDESVKIAANIRALNAEAEAMGRRDLARVPDLFDQVNGLRANVLEAMFNPHRYIDVPRQLGYVADQFARIEEKL